MYISAHKHSYSELENLKLLILFTRIEVLEVCLSQA